jgi:ligand-binding SRPBCC domain-containing protein
MKRMRDRVFTLEREQLVRRSLEEVFEFFSDPINLEEITPTWLNFRVARCSTPVIMGGTTIEYRLRLHGIPVRWRSRISHWDPPYGFVDEQIAGPYKLWIHRHTFVQTPEGVLVRDQVEYAIPGGAFIHWLFVRRDLEQIFDYRSECLARLLKVDQANGASNGGPVD